MTFYNINTVFFFKYKNVFGLLYCVLLAFWGGVYKYVGQVTWKQYM